MDEKIPEPSAEEVKKWIAIWKSKEYKKSQVFKYCTETVFKEFPNNTVKEEILAKAKVLNMFYSTNIMNVEKVAEHIQKLGIDKRLNKNPIDEKLVDEIAEVHFDTKTYNFFSFATKYCSLHRPDSYCKYDSKAFNMLKYFAKNGTKGFNTKDSGRKKLNFKKYSDYVEILRRFRNTYGLQEFSNDDLDHYLWLAGKEYFN